jgi:superfamily II DNA or RNA helicase
MGVLPTGGGKTFCFSSIVERSGKPTVCIAHRSELVSQMSIALAREGVRHNIVGASTLPRQIVSTHQEEFGRSFYDPNSPYAVGSVQTMAKLPDNHPLYQRSLAWVSDEFHHTLRGNIWGTVVAKFRPDARGLGVTATPCRGDGKGLGRHADGVVDKMVLGPSMRDLIDAGYLTDYRIIVAQSDIKLDEVRHTASGDFNLQDLGRARKESRITGDLVRQYQRWANGKLCCVFDVDVESANTSAAAYRAAGIKAEVLTGTMDPYLRAATLRKFKAREIHVLVSVDIVSEGFDLPAIEAVQFARPTESYGLFVQQMGRGLRLMLDPDLMAMWEDLTPERRLELIASSSKPRAIIIDHVGNVVRHGLPDAPRQWTLDGGGARSKGKDPDAIPLRSCLNPECAQPYERFHTECPYCGHVPEPVARSKPEFVDGDLVELDESVLAAMRGEISRIDRDEPFYPLGVAHPVRQSIRKMHLNRQQTQHRLREAMAIWGGWQSSQGYTDRQIAKRFFLVYRTDVLSAQALGAPEAAALHDRISTDLNQAGVIAS